VLNEIKNLPQQIINLRWLEELKEGAASSSNALSGNKVNISPNKGNAFVLPENYSEGVTIFTFTAHGHNHSSTGRISSGDIWRRNADRVNSALWTD
jgi:hypothetical protein